MEIGGRTTIDRVGRIVIPKAVRSAAGLEPGMKLLVRAVEGAVEITAAPRDVTIARHGRLHVARPSEGSEALTAEAVERTRRTLRKPDRG